MAIPADVTSIVVTGTYVDASGTPATGTVTFTPSTWTASAGENAVLPPSSIVTTLGTAGDIRGTLVVTNDTDLQPQPWQYDVVERVNGVVREFTINLPSTLGGTVDMADLVPALPAGTAYYSLVSSLSIGTVTTIPTGGTATADITGDAPNQLLNLGLVTGPAGPQGPAGPATIAVGTVTSVSNAGTATVVNSGTNQDAVFDFVLRDGPTGPQGTAASITVGTVSSVTNAGTASVVNSGTSENAILDFVLRDGPTGPQGPQGIQGATGPTGTAASVTVGTVGFVAYPGPGTVTNSGTSGSAVLDFILVQGPQGDIAGLTATQPIDYTAGNFSLFYGAGLGTATGGTLVANLSDANAQALGAAAAGTLTTISRADHVHPYPTAAQVGAVGTATTITAGTALAGGGDLSASRTLNVVLSDTAAAAVGTASSAGTAVLPARADHVHSGATSAGETISSFLLMGA